MKYGGSMFGWKAWYEDGSTYSSEDFIFQELPAEGIVGVVEFYDTGRRFVNGGDWYYWSREEQCVEYVSSAGWDSWAGKPKADCTSCVKKSGKVTDEVWDQIRFEMRTARVTDLRTN